MAEKVRGNLKWFEKKRGYGFCTSNGVDYFVHISQLGREISEGDAVTFEIEKTEKGFSAVNVERFIEE